MSDFSDAAIWRRWHGGEDPFGDLEELLLQRRALLAALKAAEHTLDVHGHIDSGTALHEAIRAAIAKASPTTPRPSED